MRILFLSQHCPFGPTYGAQLRARHLARILKRHGELEMLLFPYEAPDAEALAATRAEFGPVGIHRLSRHPRPELSARLRREFDPYHGEGGGAQVAKDELDAILARIDAADLVWFHGVAIPNGLGRKRWPGAVLDIDDVPSQVHASRARRAKRLPDRLRALRQTALWRRRERVLGDRFDRLCVCSEADRDYLGGGERIDVIPNGFEEPTDTPAPAPVEPPRLGFIGTFHYAPNVNGMRWFMERVWPRLRERRPDAVLRLVGSGTDEGLVELPAGAEGLGFVDDVDAEIASWSATVVPILVGGGTRIKIAEAFARRVPVVSTRLGAHGYDEEDGRECLLADDPEAFANACLRLIEDREFAAGLVERARRSFERRWSWEAIAPRVGEVVANCRLPAATPA